MRGQKGSIIEVRVCDFAGKILRNAKVTLQPLAEKPGKIIDLKFTKPWQEYRGFNVSPGRYLLQAQADGYEADKREVQTDPGGLKDLFILGKKGMPFYYRGKVKVPFEPLDDLLGVSVKPDPSGKEEEKLRKYAEELKLRHEEVGEAIRKDNVRVFRFPPQIGKKNKADIQQRMSKHQRVRFVGPVVRMSKESVSFLTNELVVKFKAHVTSDEVPGIAKRYELEVLRAIPYAGNAFLLRAFAPASYDLLKICAEIAESGMVEYAEPNLIITMVDDQVNPTDFLYAQQWHLPLVNLPNAWQTLRNANPPGVMPGDPGDLTFGSENIVIAVMDRGIQSQTVGGVATPSHPDFNGTVTGGANKVYQLFDFVNMVPNNDAPPNNHGMGCSGVATALANNASVVPGENEGVVGAAPNSRVIGLIRPAGGSDIQYSDAYIWAAGFDPNSTQAGFPARISPGADVISNSFGEPASASPISGLMKDCFDYLTTYGRGGKGVVLFFSAGNDDTVFSVPRPWAAYEKTIAVAASTNTDVRAGYSNYGNGVDICAPSSNGVNITSCDWIGNGNLAGHTGGGLDYTSGFGGTSSSSPFAAGVAALMLSVNPDLNWVEVRQILRDTAVHIDGANVDPIGQWVDTDGDGVADYSQWYGYGRIDAQAAVQGALALVGVDPLLDIDTWIKENAADVGNVPSLPPYSPDVWVRNLSPAADDPAHVTEHLPPIREQDNWVYANVRNRGALASHDVYVRIMITRWAGTQYIYPYDFLPTVSPSTPPAVMAPGAYLIGEAHIPSIPAVGFVTINMIWPAALIPPATVTIDGQVYSWADSCLLVEVSPHDGPAPTGNHTWDNNNLCQRNITISDHVDDDEFALAFVVGHPLNDADVFNLRIERKNLPAGVKLFFDYVDAGATKDAVRFLDEVKKHPRMLETCDLTILTGAKGQIYCSRTGETSPVAIAPKTRFRFPCCCPGFKPLGYRMTPEVKGKRTVFGLPAARNAYVPVARKKQEFRVVALRGKGLKNLNKGEYQIDIYQEDLAGNLDGGINFIIRKK